MTDATLEKAIKSGSKKELTQLFQQLANSLIDYYENLGFTEADQDEMVKYAFQSMKKYNPDRGKTKCFFITTMSCYLKQI